jgi:hypothetical protein
MESKTEINRENLTKNLKIITSISQDEQRIFLQVDYMDGKFTVEKSFSNNYIGLEEFQNEYSNFNTDEKVQQYFGL